MAKGGKQGAKKGGGGPLNARLSYLFQAAQYLSEVSGKARAASNDVGNLAHNADFTVPPSTIIAEADTKEEETTNEGAAVPVSTTTSTNLNSNGTSSTSPAFTGTTHHLLGQLRAVSLKSQIRLSQDVKHAVCKRCDGLLVPGVTCTVRIENASKGGRKKWADVQVVKCECGAARRVPIGARRQVRKGLREKAKGLGKQKEDSIEEQVVVARTTQVAAKTTLSQVESIKVTGDDGADP